MPTTDVDIIHYHRTTAHTHPRFTEEIRGTTRSQAEAWGEAAPVRGMFGVEGIQRSGAQGHLYPIR